MHYFLDFKISKFLTGHFVPSNSGLWIMYPGSFMILRYHAHSMKKVDSHIQGTGNEGCDWHTTYMTSALLVQLCKEKQGTRRKFSLDHAQRPYPYYAP